MSSINIIFFSNKCESSKLLLSLMEQERVLKYFHPVCTDNNPNIPAGIKVTPTILIRGVPIPYEAGMAFNWLAKVKQYNMNVMFQKASTAQQQYIQNINNNLVSDSNVLSFSKAEMDGMSDIFAYLQQDAGMPHTYVDYSNLGTENILTPPLENGEFKINELSKKQISLNETKFAEMNKKLELERKKQDDIFKTNIDQFRKQYTKKN